MIKKFYFILAMVFLLFAFASCGYNPSGSGEGEGENDSDITVTTTDIWDGSIASSFSSGNGTENDPYKISTAAELAFLAKSVNDGESYQGKYLLLNNNIDLNGLEWTPIGNGINSFMGIFDGKGLTVKNLKITQGVRYDYEYTTGKEISYSDAGLFATVQDVSIQNLIIDGATINIYNDKFVYAHHVGALCGTVRAYQGTSVISNIDIRNVTLAIVADSSARSDSTYIGGAIGYIYAYNNTTTTVSLVDVISSVSTSDGYGSENHIGTIIGASLTLDSTFNLENSVGYQTLSVSFEQYYYNDSKNFCGAIGVAQASARPFSIKNVFSKTTVNKPALDSDMTPLSAIVSHAIIGDSYYFTLINDTTGIGYTLENAFGCVEHVDEAGGKQIFTKLYELPEGLEFSQINCQGCETLPENNGFDTAIWDLSDLENPKLKKQ